MQQPPPSAYFYPPNVYNQDGSGQAQQWMQDTKQHHNQFQPWDNSTVFHMATGNYGPGQVGGGQNRVPVQQQSQTPSHPPPTSTPPNIHGDMGKQQQQQQQVMQSQQGQMNYVPRQIAPNYVYPRASIAQPRMPNHQRVVTNNFMPQGMLAAAPTQTLVQTYPATVMFPQRQGGGPFPPNQLMFHHPSYINATAAQHAQHAAYYSQVMPQPYQALNSGGPSPQGTAQQSQVPLLRPPQVQPMQVTTAVKSEPKKRAFAIKIVNPETQEEVLVDSESSSNNNNITPTRSNDSSARETPQPNSGVSVVDTTLAADFAARVAARAMDSEPPTEPSPEPMPAQDSISSDSEIHHKQLPLVVPSSEKVSNPGLSLSSEEFIPRSLKQAQSCEPPSEDLKTPFVPTVSAETNSPVVEIQRPKEQFPALKNPTMPPGAVTLSPVRVNSKKQKSESERPAPNVPVATVLPPPTADIKDVSNNKKGPKSAQKEDVPISKERREKTRVASKEQSPVSSSVVIPDSSSSQADALMMPTTKPSLPSATFATREVVKSNSATPTTAPQEETAVKLQQHQNGETAVAEPSAVAVDGNKTARQKNKKSTKMRDINRKGSEKEGSDMDAFTSETNIMNDDRPMTPVSPPPPPPPAIKLPPTPPPPSLELVAPQSPVDKIKEDLVQKEDKLVAAKNEENAKMSALSKLELEREPAPVIAPAKPTPPPISLRHSYKKDQWSPLNPDGKKKYDRDFLMLLKQEPQSTQRPDNLPDIISGLNKDSSNQMRNQSMGFINRGDLGGIVPAFMQRNSQSQRGPLPNKRGSQQGMKNKGPKVIHMSLSLNEDVKLKTAENAWKPNRLVSNAEKTEEEKQTEELYKNVRGILNKLTPQKFDTLTKRFSALPINSEERLIGVINLIFEKAVDEPSFSKAYAHMCKLCSKIEVLKVVDGNEVKANFRKLLITRCQNEFESNKPEMLDSEKHLEEIRNCTDPEQKKELQLAFEEKERQLRMKSVGNIRFIGELFKLQMLTPAIMFRCIEHLLANPEEESLECLCKLLTTIGKDLEYGHPNPQQVKQPPTNALNPYFQRMADLAQKKDSSKVSSRVRFMLQDVIELRHNKWVPRREDNNPKTIDQITKEAERESMEMTMALNQPQRMRQNDRPDDRKRGNRGSNVQGDDGWNTVSNNRHFNKLPQTTFDASKMQGLSKTDTLDLNSVSLGGSSQYRFNAGVAKMENKPGFVSSNVYSALQSRDDRTPFTQPNMNNRRIAQSPSIEKDKERERERQRMIQGVEVDGRSSRGNSAQRERPQPTSLETPQPRQPSVNKDNKEVEAMQNKDTKTPDEKPARLTGEKLERQTITIFEEYIGSFSGVDDVRQDVEQLYPAEEIGCFVQKALEMSLEKKEGAQEKIGLLITSLMDYNLIAPDIIVKEFGLIYEMADDFAIDVPKVWELQAQILVPILAAEKINFSHFKSACSSVLKTPAALKLLVPVLNILVKEKGVGFVRKVWDSSNVSLNDFLPPDVNVDAFIKEKSLEYLTGEAPVCDDSVKQVSMDQVQESILQMLRSNYPFDKIIEVISNKVGDKVEDLEFIRALVTAICEACLSESFGIDRTKFKEFGKLIQRYVDNKENRELACLTAVHLLMVRLEHPQGLVVALFTLLSDELLISTESFLKWRDEKENVKEIGVTIMSLGSFFSSLEEVDSDEEVS